MSTYETHAVEVAGLKRDLRLFEIKPGLKIAILNILGDKFDVPVAQMHSLRHACSSLHTSPVAT